MWRWVLWIVGGLAALGAATYALGFALPRDHVAQSSRLIPMPIEQAAARIRNVRAYPEWRGDIALEITGESEGAVAYIENQDGDRVSYRLTEPERGRRFVAVITDDTLPYGGQWTFTLTPEGDATRVTVEEDGEIRDPLYRVFARFVFGYTASMDAYLDRLEASALSRAPTSPPDR